MCKNSDNDPTYVKINIVELADNLATMQMHARYLETWLEENPEDSGGLQVKESHQEEYNDLYDSFYALIESTSVNH